jgi:hypothetical protein
MRRFLAARSGRELTLGLFGVILVLLGACGEEQSPVEAVRSFMRAVEVFDVSTAESLVCEPKRSRVQESLRPFEEAVGPGEAFDMSYGDLVVQEQSNDGEVAVVQVRGSVTISFLGQQEVQEISEEHVLIKQNGRWVICDP